MATSASPSRHVLGWKTTNASIPQRGPEQNNKHITVARASTFEQLWKDRVNISKTGSPRIGQKRSIAQVDGTEEHTNPPLQEWRSQVFDVSGDKKDNASMVEGDNDVDNETPNAKVVTKEDGDETEPSTAESKTTTTTLLTSFHASQEGSVPLEEQFIIQEEASQKTLENLVRGKLNLQDTHRLLTMYRM